MHLRPYQSEALQIISDKLSKRVNRQLVKWPTGMGKTVLFANLPDALNMKGRMLVLAHRVELIEQAASKLSKWNAGRSVGIEMAGRESDGEQIVIASVPTIGLKGSMRIRKLNPKDFDVIVIDEAHHATARTYMSIVEHFTLFDDRHRLLLGVTATPNRADGEGLGKVFEEIVHDVSMLDAINQGWLANLRGMALRTKENLDQVRTLAGEFHLGDLGTSVNTPARNDLIVRSWKTKAENLSTVAFCVNVDHAKALAVTFKSYGIAAEAVWGYDRDRSEKLDRHRQGLLKVICNCQILTEGYDDWEVACIILARPTKSEGLYTQMIGRGTRIPEGINNLLEARALGKQIAKADCLIIDCVDATAKHSLVTLSSLFGLGAELDLRGQTITEEVNQPKQFREHKPLIPAKIDDKNKIQGYVELVDLFGVEKTPDAIKNSPFQWIKTGPSAYTLLLPNGEIMTARSNLRGKGHVSGSCKGKDIYNCSSTLDEALRWAEEEVRSLGAKKLVSLLTCGPSRPGLPGEGLIKLAQHIGIRLSANMTAQQLMKKINDVIAQQRTNRSVGMNLGRKRQILNQTRYKLK